MALRYWVLFGLLVIISISVGIFIYVSNNLLLKNDELAECSIRSQFGNATKCGYIKESSDGYTNYYGGKLLETREESGRYFISIDVGRKYPATFRIVKDSLGISLGNDDANDNNDNIVYGEGIKDLNSHMGSDVVVSSPNGKQFVEVMMGVVEKVPSDKIQEVKDIIRHLEDCDGQMEEMKKLDRVYDPEKLASKKCNLLINSIDVY